MYIEKPPSIAELLGKLGPDRVAQAFTRLATAAEGAGEEYVHWDKLRHLTPPEDLTHEEWWLWTKLGRRPLQRQLPLVDVAGTPFTYALPDKALRLLRYADQRCAGEIAMAEVVTADDQAKQHYLVNSLMEEAIRSSQLEGATTSRSVAKELIRSGREPRNRSERMIVNHYRALLFMRSDMQGDLTPKQVLRLQEILTDGTLDNPDATGRLQLPEEERVGVYDLLDGSLLHSPPPAEQLPERLEKMCTFANQGEDDAPFIHPVIRSILLHFWLAFDHPFEDGNGRTARTLFYWSMRRNGYWLTEYLSISRILREAPAQYSRAFMYTERDENDTTYFILYQLEVIKRAVEELHKYLRRKVREVRKVEELLSDTGNLNHRQLALLSDAIRNPTRRYSYAIHASSHRVTHETARHDLHQLERMELLTRSRVGRRHLFGISTAVLKRTRS